MRMIDEDEVDLKEQPEDASDVDDDIQSIHQFTTKLTVEAAARCIKTIDNGIDVQHKLPPSMSARFRIGTSLAKALQDLGYRGDVGYQTFLYSNEADLRRVFIFLLEKLPKGATETQDEVLGASARLDKSIGSDIRKRLSSPWTPPFCKTDGISWRGIPAQWQREGVSGMYPFRSISLAYPKGLSDHSKQVPKDVQEYHMNMPFVQDQPPQSDQILSALLEDHSKRVTEQQEWENEWNHMGLASRLTPEEYKSQKRQKIDKRIQDHLQSSMKEYEKGSDGLQDLHQLIDVMGSRTSSQPNTKGSRFTHAQKLQFAPDDEKTVAQVGVGEGPRLDTEEELQAKREEELDNLRDELTTITSKLENMQLSIKKMKAGMTQSGERVSRLEHENKEKKDAHHIKKKTMDLLPDAENNIAKLQDLVDSSAQRLVKLANQWENHRVPLVSQYRQLKELSGHQQSEVDDKLSAIREIRERMKEAATETRNKDVLLRQLHLDYENMTKDVNRSAYTKRILEIVSNIKKQKQQIDKVLLDTKLLQKDINSLTGKLDRTFTVTDELIFKDAKKDETARKAYKHLAGLHQNCSAVIQTVEETGFILREIRDLEDQVEQESKKNILESLSKISTDCQAMKTENTTLVNKLRKQNTS